MKFTLCVLSTTTGSTPRVLSNYGYGLDKALENPTVSIVVGAAAVVGMALGYTILKSSFNRFTYVITHEPVHDQEGIPSDDDEEDHPGLSEDSDSDESDSGTQPGESYESDAKRHDIKIKRLDDDD